MFFYSVNPVNIEMTLSQTFYSLLEIKAIKISGL